ncbi:MAG: hypothetical protein ACUZ8O_06700 [Candidatus Anammoxibacter sp.]
MIFIKDGMRKVDANDVKDGKKKNSSLNPGVKVTNEVIRILLEQSCLPVGRQVDCY